MWYLVESTDHLMTHIQIGGCVRVEQEEINTRENQFSRDPWRLQASLYTTNLFYVPRLLPRTPEKVCPTTENHHGRL